MVTHDAWGGVERSTARARRRGRDSHRPHRRHAAEPPRDPVARPILIPTDVPAAARGRDADEGLGRET